MNTTETQAPLTTSQTHGHAGGAAEGFPGGAGQPPAALPCQDNHKCIEKEKYQRPSHARLTPNQKLIRQKMIEAAKYMVRKHGLERVGVLTLSFGVPGSGKGSFATWALRQQAKHWDFVQARWHSFYTNVVAKRYADWVCVFEMHRDKVWHMHVIVATKEDIRTGTNLEVLGNYKLPYWMRRGKHLRNTALAAEWAMLRQTCCRYRFGRVELLPVKKSGQAVGLYLGDYLVKTYNVIPAGQRSRLVRFSKQINQVITTPFAIHSLGTLIYRTRLRIAAGMLNFQEYEDFAEYFGPRWNYYLRNAIAWIPIPFRFQKGAFESGQATKMLMEYAQHPKCYLDERGKHKIDDVGRELWRRLEETFEDNPDSRATRSSSLPRLNCDVNATRSMSVYCGA
jgi:hypothetical protein